jgi:hemerythrin-like domain-containing protein
MSATSGPNLGVDLLRIHRVITRGLRVGMEHSHTYGQDGLPDDATGAGFLDYVQALASVVHGHHLSENEVAFPYFRDKLPEIPFDLLMEEHKAIELRLQEIGAALEKARGDLAVGQALRELNVALTKTDDLWHYHIPKEEHGLRPDVLGPMLAPEEHVRLARELAQHSQEHSGPDYLVVPFMLYNLGPEDRAVLSQSIPPVVTQQLVPVAWKEKWAPMKPFLLE